MSKRLSELIGELDALASALDEAVDLDLGQAVIDERASAMVSFVNREQRLADLRGPLEKQLRAAGVLPPYFWRST